MAGYREAGGVLIAIGKMMEFSGLDQMPVEIVRRGQMLEVDKWLI